MKIPLINGGLSLVDEEDYEFLSQFTWRRNQNGYAFRTSHKPYTLSRQMHRIVAQTPVGMATDHINGDRLDNRRSNLRVCTMSQNARNTNPLSTNKHGLRGVCWCKQTGRWKAYVTYMGKQVWLGRFDELADALKARETAASQIGGEFHRDNKVEYSKIKRLQAQSVESQS